MVLFFYAVEEIVHEPVALPEILKEGLAEIAGPFGFGDDI